MLPGLGNISESQSPLVMFTVIWPGPIPNEPTATVMLRFLVFEVECYLMYERLIHFPRERQKSAGETHRLTGNNEFGELVSCHSD
jgi:hypothetical protein